LQLTLKYITVTVTSTDVVNLADELGEGVQPVAVAAAAVAAAVAAGCSVTEVTRSTHANLNDTKIVN